MDKISLSINGKNTQSYCCPKMIYDICQFTTRVCHYGNSTFSIPEDCPLQTGEIKDVIIIKRIKCKQK